MAHSLPVKIRRTEFASSDPDELREVIDRGFGSRLQLAVPRRRGWRATVSQVDAGYFTSTDTRLPADLTFTNDGHDDSFVIDTGPLTHRGPPGHSPHPSRPAAVPSDGGTRPSTWTGCWPTPRPRPRRCSSAPWPGCWPPPP